MPSNAERQRRARDGEPLACGRGRLGSGSAQSLLWGTTVRQPSSIALERRWRPSWCRSCVPWKTTSSARAPAPSQPISVTCTSLPSTTSSASAGAPPKTPSTPTWRPRRRSAGAAQYWAALRAEPRLSAAVSGPGLEHTRSLQKRTGLGGQGILTTWPSGRWISTYFLGGGGSGGTGGTSGRIGTGRVPGGNRTPPPVTAWS